MKPGRSIDWELGFLAQGTLWNLLESSVYALIRVLVRYKVGDLVKRPLLFLIREGLRKNETR